MLASLTPCLRHKSATETPASWSFNIPILVKAAGDDERAAVSFAHQLEHPQRARVGFDPLLDCAGDGWVDDVQIGEATVAERFGDGTEGRFRLIVAHVVEGAERRQSHADAVLTPNIAHRLDHFYEQSHPVLDRTAISVGAPIGARIDELVEQITIGSVDLHAVESGRQRISRPTRVLPDDVGHLLDLQGSRRYEGNQLSLAILILDERLAARLDGRGCDRKHAVGLQRRMGDASDMPELQEYQAAGLVHGVGDESPSLDLLAAVNAGRPSVALSLLRYLGRFGHDESRRSPLRVVASIESRWHVSGLAGARAGQRRHHHAVGNIVAPQPDRLRNRVP